jgi:hypothetical protein
MVTSSFYWQLRGIVWPCWLCLDVRMISEKQPRTRQTGFEKHAQDRSDKRHGFGFVLLKS